ncbi:MAG: hypothetical protein GY780_09415 [bacterium]|nr:hypothetical protein [bacterium]
MTDPSKIKTDFNSHGPLLRLYQTISPALVGMIPHFALFSTKLDQGVSGRQGLMQRLKDKAHLVRNGLWFHVTSVGEYEQARPIIDALTQRPDAPPVLVTHFSPSGYDFALKRPCAAVHDYLPFDDPQSMNQLVSLIQPRLLVFVKFDCWPNQVLAAVRARIPVVLLAGSLAPKSGRLHPLGRSFYREIFNHFTHIGVCTKDDAERFTQELKVTCPVSITGDTRVEQVILRFEAAQDGATATELKNLNSRLLILGSTWPPDEKLWLPILPQLINSFADLKVVLTPHEPLPERLKSLENKLQRLKLSHTRLSQFMSDGAAKHKDTRIILVDSIGQLAEIYRSGDLAYVGGSFTTGVHNTMEPAVGSMPVMFGPRIQNAEEAGFLVKQGAGFVLNKPDEALKQATLLLSDNDLMKKIGTKALQVVLDQRGATKRSLEVILPLIFGAQPEAESDPHAT